MTIPERVAALIDEIGQTVTYKKRTGNSYDPETGINTPTISSESVKAAVRVYNMKLMVPGGIVQQGDREVRIGADDLSVVPEEQDQITIDGSDVTVMSVNIRKARGTDAIYILQVRG